MDYCLLLAIGVAMRTDKNPCSSMIAVGAFEEKGAGGDVSLCSVEVRFKIILRSKVNKL